MHLCDSWHLYLLVASGFFFVPHKSQISNVGNAERTGKKSNAARAESCRTQTSIRFLPPTLFAAPFGHLVPVICCHLFSVPSLPFPLLLFSFDFCLFISLPAALSNPAAGSFLLLNRGPCWIASCQSALWDTLVWAPFFLLHPLAPLVASSSGFRTDGRGRQAGSRRALGRAAHLSGPSPFDRGCVIAHRVLAD